MGLVPGPQVQLAMRVEVRPSGRKEGTAEFAKPPPRGRLSGPELSRFERLNSLKPPALPGDIYSHPKSERGPHTADTRRTSSASGRPPTFIFTIV